MKGLLQVTGRGDAHNISPWGAGSHVRMDRAGARERCGPAECQGCAALGRRLKRLLWACSPELAVDGQALTSRILCPAMGLDGRLELEPQPSAAALASGPGALGASVSSSTKRG